MNASITWNDSEKTLIIVKIARDWNLDDLKPTAQAIREHIGSVEHSVDFIIDARDLSFRQTNMLSRFANLDKNRSENRRYAIIMGLNPYLQTLLRIGAIFAPKSLSDLYFVETYKDAEQIVKQTLSESIKASLPRH